MLFGQVKASSSGRTDATVNFGPRVLLHIEGDALRDFLPRLPLWVDPATSYIYLMPDPNVGEMSDISVANLRPPGVVRSLRPYDRFPKGVDPTQHMVLEPITSSLLGEGVLVTSDGWMGWQNLRVRLERTDNNPRPWGVVDVDHVEHLVVAPLAPGWPAWHTVAVDSGEPGALFFHTDERWRTERPIPARRAVARGPWLWMAGALDAVPTEQTPFNTSSSSADPQLCAAVEAARVGATDRGYGIDFVWLGVDGDISVMGQSLRAPPVPDEHRALVAAFLQHVMPERVAWLRALREQCELMTPNIRQQWAHIARTRPPGPFVARDT